MRVVSFRFTKNWRRYTTGRIYNDTPGVMNSLIYMGAPVEPLKPERKTVPRRGRKKKVVKDAAGTE